MGRAARTDSGRSRGRRAFAGAALASILILAVLVWRGEASLAAAFAALTAMVSALLVPDAAARQPFAEPSPSQPGSFLLSAAAVPDPVILVDRRIVVAEANDAARSVFPAIKQGQPLSFGLRDPTLLEAIALVAASGEPGRVEIGGRIATEATYEVRLRRLGSGEGAALGEPVVALFFRDLSDERRLETMRVDFVANVSHELRTPLASLSGFVDTLRGSARDDPKARDRFLEIMATQAARMTRLIEDLLQLSRVELKEHLAPATPVDLGLTVAHMIEVMAPLARERGVTIALDLPSEPVRMLGDRDELLRLVENLVENAIKYGGSGGTVEVALARLPSGSGSEERVQLTVRDHGPGIPREHIPRLTERFYRVDVAESRVQGGTGLGLAIVKHIVARHRGRLLIESEPGAGASFKVQFPALS